MRKNIINIVWCDDKIESLRQNENTFNDFGCRIIDTAVTSDKLKKILNEKKALIDAVIVDFNLSKSSDIPYENEATGFREIHSFLEDYSPIPFYLFSARPERNILDICDALQINKEDNYFFKQIQHIKKERNRYFYANNSEALPNLLETIREEVENISTPEFKIRTDYSKAFNAIQRFHLQEECFLLSLAAKEDTLGTELVKLLNPMRKALERLSSKLKADDIIPKSIKLNELPKLFHGDLESYKDLYDKDDFMNNYIFASFKFFMDCTQEGSHDNSFIKADLHYYLCVENDDVYLVKTLATIGLNIIRWMEEFYDKYQEERPAKEINSKFYNGKIVDLIKLSKSDGVIVNGEEGIYFVEINNNIRESYKIGCRIRINDRVGNSNKNLTYNGRQIDWYVKYNKAEILED